MLENIINQAKSLINLNNFEEIEFKYNNRSYCIDMDSDDTFFITEEINGEWDILIDGIII